MQKLVHIYKKLTTPATLTEKDGISFWQEKVMQTLLLIAVVLGLFSYIFASLVMIQENRWYFFAIDTISYSTLIYLFVNRTLSYRIKAICLLCMIYIIGVSVWLSFGPFGEGPVWLFFFPILGGLLLGYTASFACLGINCLSLVIFGILMTLSMDTVFIDFNDLPWKTLKENVESYWISISINFMLLNTIAALSVTTILNGLQKSIQSLAASEKKYRNIFENIEDVYFETRLDGTLVEISPSIRNISMYSPEEIKKMSLLSIYSDPEQRNKTIVMLVTEGFITNHEVDFKDKDNKNITCSINARLVKDKNGQAIGAVGIFRDITAHKTMAKEKSALEEQLIRAKKMEALGLLAGGVAHDLNNILSGIVTYPELLAMDLPEDDPMRKTLKIIQSSGQRAAEIVQDLLTLSRRGVIARQILDLNEMVKGFLRTPEYKKILSYHPGIKVDTRLDANVPLLKGSMIHLQKTLMNLIINAAESQSQGGRIIIRTLNRHLTEPISGYDKVETGTYVVLSVEDKGTGINTEDLKRIFEPFFTKKIMGRSGTGLGMAVVWGTVQDHDGYIDIISKENEGTIFNLYFPVCRDEAVEQGSHFDINDYMGNGQNILIVDDMPDQLQIASEALKKLNYNPVAFDSGQAVIKYLKNHDADLLLIDMIMPEMDGLETYRQILSFKPGIKALIASGYSQTPEVDETLKLGAGGYLKKPYTIEKIGQALKNELS